MHTIRTSLATDPLAGKQRNKREREGELDKKKKKGPLEEETTGPSQTMIAIASLNAHPCIAS
jgi:hypothetical protein